jgi:uncharacterized protein (TIGR02271 family)
LRDDALWLPYDKDRVKDAPSIEAGNEPSAKQEDELYRYYGLCAETSEQSVAGQDASVPTTDEVMTRSEEWVRAGTETRESGRAWLRKYVVTEEEQISVPVSHEEVRVEREPITEANRDAALAGPELSEAEHEAVITEERPVVQKETVPVERVRLTTDQVKYQENVNVPVRAERIEADPDDGAKRR